MITILRGEPRPENAPVNKLPLHGDTVAGVVCSSSCGDDSFSGPSLKSGLNSPRKKCPLFRVISQNSYLWLVSGAILWLSAHTMTLLFPMPGPWMPASVAVPMGVLMGLIGAVASSDALGLKARAVAMLLPLTGFITGSHLGWYLARGALRGSDSFLAPSTEEKVVALVVCGLLGTLANGGLLWLMRRSGSRPLELLGTLLALLGVLLVAVYVVSSIQRSSEPSDTACHPGPRVIHA